MPQVTFIDARGGENVVAIAVGDTVMQGARDHGIDGILADCGGACSCATCHVHVDPAWRVRLAPMADDEESMLEMAIDPDENSRLSCQIVVTDDLDGLIVTLPARQF